jgi:phage terminase large subunit-like protein
MSRAQSVPSEKVRLINQLTHTKGPFAGETFRLRRWQEYGIIRPIFSVDPRTGRRRYRTVLIMMPRKNGKTELCAALAIDGLLFDNETGAEVYSAANDKEQAALCFNVAAQMIRNDAELYAACEIIDSQKRIVHRKSGSIYRAISAEAYSKHGFNASRVIYDELHAAQTRDLWDVLASSTGARAEPLVIAISTAGYDRHSILWELYQHGKKVLENPALDPTFLAVIYEAPIDADWRDEKVWRRANPALGDFRSLEELRAACQRAQEIPAQENVFRRLYLNQWTEQDARWISLAAWDACQAPPVDLATLAGRRCYVGLDLSTTTDLTAAVAVFPDVDGPGCTVVPQFFCPADRILTRVTRDRVPYDDWARRGLIVVTPGPTVDYERVRAELVDWQERYDVRMIAFDPWNATDLVSRLEKVDGFTCVKMRQGKATLSAPSKALEKAILEKTIRHDGHPILRWNIQNASVDTDNAGNIQPSKAKSTERIDGVVALVMALDAMHRDQAPPETEPEVYIFGGPA